jgi:type VI secretion system secreted protein Hcp
MSCAVAVAVRREGECGVTNTGNESSNALEPVSGMLANRRDILRTATGLAAAAVVGGALVERNQVAMAASPSSGISAQIGGLGPFAVSSFSWGVENAISIGSVSGGGGAGKATFQDLHLTRNVDVHSPALMVALASGKHYDTATITYGDKKGTPTLRLELKFVFLKSMSIDGSNGSAPAEKLVLACGAVTLSYMDASGSWNQLKNEQE